LGAVELKVKENQILEVTAGKVRATINGMGMEEFPQIREGNGVAMGTVRAEELQRVLERVGFAVSRDEGRPVLTGVLWEIASNRWVATDGYRLSMATVQVGAEAGTKLPEKLLLGERLLSEGLRAWGEMGLEQAKLTLFEASKQVALESDEVTLVGRWLEGEYPQYEGIIPDKPTLVATVDRSEWARAVKTASIFARDSAHIIKMKIGKGQVEVSANTPQVGENQVEVEAEIEGEAELTIAFNSKYLADLISHASSERIRMGFTQSLKPGVFWEEDRKVFQHIIMPVRVRGGE
jgi:DNA polymerase-3 subunit beta